MILGMTYIDFAQDIAIIMLAVCVLLLEHKKKNK